MEEPMVKRAITLGGGGPAAGLHIGVLDALATAGIEFDVWSLSCIGAWVGIVYNQFDDKVKNEDRAKLTHEFFKAHVFRDDESYERFPINSVFGTDWYSNTKFLMKYVSHPKNYTAVWQPHAMMNAFAETCRCSLIRGRNGMRETSMAGSSIRSWRPILSCAI
jgi:predicted acylesterase/phospholipase RssA